MTASVWQERETGEGTLPTIEQLYDAAVQELREARQAASVAKDELKNARARLEGAAATLEDLHGLRDRAQQLPLEVTSATGDAREMAPGEDLWTTAVPEGGEDAEEA